MDWYSTIEKNGLTRKKKQVIIMPIRKKWEVKYVFVDFGNLFIGYQSWYF